MKYSVLAATCLYTFKTSAESSSSLGQRGTTIVDTTNQNLDNAFVVPKNFVGLGIESAFANSFNNTFSKTLVRSLANRMSQPPIIRIGGTSGDYFTYDPEQTEPTLCVGPEEECNGHLGVFSIGPSYFDVFENFEDAYVIIQAPLGNPINTRNTLDYVWSAWNRLGQGERVSTIALGNEVEFIYESGAQAYVDNALQLQDSIVANLSLSGEATNIFEAGNSASGSVATPKLYQGDDILKVGMNDNGRTSALAEHWYQIMNQNLEWTDDNMQRLMINHKAIVDRFAMYAPSMEAARSQGIAYAITEDAAVLGGAPTSFSGGFGYALWAVDFNLAAMARGVSRVTNLAGRPSAKRVFWVPDGSAGEANPGPHVRAPFPAAMFVADFVGMGDPAAVKEVVIGGADLLSAYAMYDDETRRLERVALVNMRLYNGTSSGEQERPKETFQVAVPDGVKSARVRRLRADLGVASMGYDFGGPEHNVTWAGEQWTYAVDQGNGHFPSGGVVEKVVEVQGGTVTVVIPNSEAVILFMQY